MILEDILYFGQDAQDRLKAGIQKLAKAVASTMGPSGRFFIIGGNPTKDGVSVAEYIVLVDPIEDMGANMLKQTASKTVKDTGDGTTTATVLASSLILSAPNNIKNVTEFTKGMKKALKDTISELEGIKIDTPSKDQLYAAALTSSNGDEEIAEIVAKAWLEVGKGGIVEPVEGLSPLTTYDITSGYKFDQGYSSSNYINKADKAIFEATADIYVLLLDAKLEDFNLIHPVIADIKNRKGLLIVIAEDFSSDVQHNCMENFLKHGQSVIPIKSAEFGERRTFGLEDLAIYLNEGKVHTIQDLKSESVKLLPGTASYIKIHKDYTIIRRRPDNDKAIKNRITQIKALEKESINPYDKEKLTKRISQLSAGHAIIKVGGDTASEIKEKFDRYEDLIGATHAALKDGILPGGGVALYNVSYRIFTDETGDFKDGYECVRNTLKAPMEQILFNADITFTPTKEILGINAKTGKEVDMIKEGIIDPFKVTTSALTNAVSVASLVISTGGVAQSNFLQTQN